MSGDTEASECASARYAIPKGPLRLSGPVARPAPGALPLRGDLAHIALAGTHLAAHYVIPGAAQIGGADVTLKQAPDDGAEDHVSLPAGSAAELLDEAGDWVWLCCGPEGPAGYCRLSALQS